MPRDWFTRSQFTCNQCGHVSRSAGEEARHRHNFPAYCKPKLVRCFGANKDGSQCRRMVTTRKGGACSWHSHQKRS